MNAIVSALGDATVRSSMDWKNALFVGSYFQRRREHVKSIRCEMSQEVVWGMVSMMCRCEVCDARARNWHANVRLQDQCGMCGRGLELDSLVV